MTRPSVTIEATAARVSEAQFQRSLIELAQALGYLCYHTHDSRHSAAGYPDLTLVRGERVLFAELKTDHGVLSAQQKIWLAALAGAGCEIHVWRPSQWLEIVDCLKRRRGEPPAAQQVSERPVDGS